MTFFLSIVFLVLLGMLAYAGYRIMWLITIVHNDIDLPMVFDDETMWSDISDGLVFNYKRGSLKARYSANNPEDKTIVNLSNITITSNGLFHTRKGTCTVIVSDYKNRNLHVKQATIQLMGGNVFVSPIHK